MQQRFLSRMFVESRLYACNLGGQITSWVQQYKPLISALERQKQVDLYEFNPCLVYIQQVSIQLWIQNETLSQKQTKQKPLIFMKGTTKKGEVSIHFELHSRPISSQNEDILVKHLFSLFLSGTHKTMTSTLLPQK